MHNIIKLNKNLYSKIAAGEVIENPASIIRELIDNSIDANAKNINIRIIEAGKSEIEVSDDGIGMSLSDLNLYFKNHTTSKIRNLNDLFNINSFGFRGEALFSISNVAEVEISSRNETDKTGKKIKVINGKKILEKDVICNIGTTIVIKNLFNNIPARKKFLKSSFYETKKIKETIISKAIPFPNISFRFFDEKNDILLLNQTNELSDRLETIFGKTIRENLINIQYEEFENKIFLHGYISKPTFNNKKNELYFYVNKREVQYPSIFKIMSIIYDKTILKGNKYFAILFLYTEPNRFDINIHPAKRDIKFSNEKEIFSFLVKALKSNLNKDFIAPSYNPPPSFHNVPKKEEEHKQISSETTKPKQLNINFRSNSCGEEAAELQNETSRNTFKVMGKYLNTYILTEINEKLLIIDQHAAAERINYEKIHNSIKSKNHIRQKLLTPITIETNNNIKNFILNESETLLKIGYEIEFFGDTTFVINSIPFFVNLKDVNKLFIDLVEKLIDEEIEISVNTILDKHIAQEACRSSIMAGDYITDDEAYSLIDKLMKTKNPYICPHGRPTIIEINKYEMEKMFKRKI